MGYTVVSGSSQDLIHYDCLLIVTFNQQLTILKMNVVTSKMELWKQLRLIDPPALLSHDGVAQSLGGYGLKKICANFAIYC